MTGAPKKRSCKILREIEQRHRGIYSGVIGYLDIGGAGDFSVVIRTAVRHEPGVNGQGDRWHIGAGGAITLQSTDEAEYREMEVKATSALIAFLPDKVQGEP
jgi:para-aminobenzoate synthetase